MSSSNIQLFRQLSAKNPCKRRFTPLRGQSGAKRRGGKGNAASQDNIRELQPHSTINTTSNSASSAPPANLEDILAGIEKIKSQLVQHQGAN
ncbi:RNA-binding Raly-like protein [Caenorhabditis elegans]|uniref:RNA-binding Raly-like protein n=1 Tax=Caenorhabditis elegans TaxID=6239 RepID=Q564S1_CAEEL|nr:RNA-binding Raly-like protein [Caenorhabditis elegans]CAI79196.2 RNA-binding Raly-like protein [Caenorhabditis elegans]|eukprot:NP_001023226.2 Uncharacterized protein CELE_F55B11.6 [Caenorhabditis elegans]